MRAVERWRPAFYACGLSDEGCVYLVSNLGRVKNVKTGRITKGRINKQGYRVVDLLGKSFNLHSVVWRTFEGEPVCSIGRLDVDHINDDKADCRLSNLQAITHLDNIRKARRSALRRAT